MTDIPGFEKLYAVTENGQVWSYRTKRFLRPGKTSRGRKYLVVNLYRGGKVEMWYVHRLVALTYLGDHLHLQVNHKDFDTFNNHLSNLEWVTNGQNMRHLSASGRMRRKRRNPSVLCLPTDELIEYNKLIAR